MKIQNSKFKSQKSDRKKFKFSIVIPTKKISDYLINKTILALIKQTYSDFELIIVSEEKSPIKHPEFVNVIISKLISPPEKRDLGAKQAKGEILAFIDSDVYPTKNWLEEINKAFQDKDIAAVGGPGLTPPDDSLREKVSGFIWQSWLGAGGAGIYRNNIEPERYIDDYPTFNLAIRKSDYEKAGGFDCVYWPGEDTKICHEIVHKLNKKIIYCPKCVVYHHRRSVYVKHLEQIGRYGFQRGRFVWLMPANNLKLGYFVPSAFLLLIISYLLLEITNIFVNLMTSQIYYLMSFVLAIYWLLVLIDSLNVFSKSKNIEVTLLYIPTLFLTHIYYGYKFILGFVSGFKEKLLSH